MNEINGKKLAPGIAPNVAVEALMNAKRKVFLFGSPSYTNIGDQAVAYAEEKFIKNHFPYYEYIEIMDYATDTGIAYVQGIIKKGDIVCFTGGGNLGNLYLPIERDRRKVIEAFKDYQTLVFPQSAFFEESEKGAIEKKKTQEAYGKNPNLTLVARESQTLDVLKSTFDCDILYTPDMVLSLRIEPRSLDRKGILFVLRKDKEKVTDENFISRMMDWAGRKAPVARTDTVLTDIDKIEYAGREKYLLKMLHQIGSSQLIITDRLHAMIFSIITETPCLVFGNSYGKAKHSYRDWLQKLNYIAYTDKQDINELEQMIQGLLKAEPNQVDLRADFQPLRDFFKR
ncbi:MAG: polysaccharide pyruvyl transferase family protein [Sporolactobacillus sp.]